MFTAIRATSRRRNRYFEALGDSSRKGAETAAVLFSVTASCHRHEVNAFAYLQDLLQRLAHDPQPSREMLRAWLQDRWRPLPAPTAEP